MLVPFLGGLGLGTGLIVAIGAQNAFVLRQGLKHHYPFVTAAIRSISDAALIMLGVAGLGSVISQSAFLKTAATWGGITFLVFYGIRALRSALQAGVLEAQTEASGSLRDTVLSTLAFSLLNPHVYLDTVVILGSVGSTYPADERIPFALGAMLASVTWFFGLVYGAGYATPLFQRRITWRILDSIIGVIMFIIAGSLLSEVIK